MTTRTPPAEILLDMLAVYRATKLLQDDQVPPLPKVRQALMDRYGHTPWSQLLDCPWCLSPHVAVVAVLARHVTPRLWRVTARVLAASAATGLISLLADHLTPQEWEPLLPPPTE